MNRFGGQLGEPSKVMLRVEGNIVTWAPAAFWRTF